jgi:hypothetical protein
MRLGKGKRAFRQRGKHLSAGPKKHFGLPNQQYFSFRYRIARGYDSENKLIPGDAVF